MKPLFLGSAERRLYGVYHPAARAGRHAVLLCYPGVQEYSSAHWAFRRLAAMLARDGHHVLRFDYFGTGDSAGESADGNPSLWIDDVEQAAQELLDQSGARELSLVGMRLGASLALLACTRGLKARRLVLWEPVVKGLPYVRELEKLDERRNLILLHADRTRGRRDELLGHPFPPAVRRATEGIDLATSEGPKADATVIVTDRPTDEQRALQASLERNGKAASLKTVVDEAQDGRQEVRERAMLVGPALTAIAQELRSVISS